jgi:hypothetical protein
VEAEIIEEKTESKVMWNVLFLPTTAAAAFYACII